MNAKKSEMYLFFDTETTGLPILNSVPAEVFAGNWPRLAIIIFLVLCMNVLGTMCGGNSNWGE